MPLVRTSRAIIPIHPIKSRGATTKWKIAHSTQPPEVRFWADLGLSRTMPICRGLPDQVRATHQGTHRQSVSTTPFSQDGKFRLGFPIGSHCRRTPLRLECDLPLSLTSPAWSNAYRGRTPGRCDRPEHRPISIRLEPEGITPRANVKPGTASRGIAAAKETCSGTN
jgi:hypothetical protein